MQKKIKAITLVLLILFIAIQCYQPAGNVHKGKVAATDISRSYNIPADVKVILQSSCYDCHSNHTNYVWYDYIQPARMVVESHIKKGKKELNFNEWGTYSDRKKERLLTAIKKQIETNEMPLPSYTLLHRNARLGKKELQTVISWFNQQINNND
ncbi:heme-binding domain-containing protein [Niabella sp. CC-SYL272]|uniref:heme-binding domain-containing protein n=1 Tax=Niabella agricola TaxID=2891571 RepID=UPI001F3C1001|nr:heme-binding domain-containing protein [Niabella agricola]MCF3107566.1 heme-binding domain-containing protein [Niabella agricola]